MPPGTPSYPVALRLGGLPCLVVGGGPVALRKVRGLLRAGALVTVVAPALEAELRELPVERLERPFAPADLEGKRLAVTATGRAEVDRRVHEAAEARGIFVNAADDPPSCSFYLPAILRRGTVSVAVSTEGESPALAAVLRDRLAASVGEEVGTVARVLGGGRRDLHGAGQSTLGLAWRPVVEELLEAAAGGEGEAALKERLRRFLEGPASGGEPRPGWGAPGPGE